MNERKNNTGSSVNPHVFTEQGVAMLSSIPITATEIINRINGVH